MKLYNKVTRTVVIPIIFKRFFQKRSTMIRYQTTIRINDRPHQQHSNKLWHVGRRLVVPQIKMMLPTVLAGNSISFTRLLRSGVAAGRLPPKPFYSTEHRYIFNVIHFISPPPLAATKGCGRDDNVIIKLCGSE